jgi:N-glycosylase/DNA lyase
MNYEKIDEIQEIYSKIKSEITSRINDFKNIWINGTQLDIFIELVFCILTPQSKAIMADKIITNLKSKNLFFCDDINILSAELNLVRFKNNKAKYIFEARKLFTQNKNVIIKNKINPENIIQSRDWFVTNVKGIGYKESSHFFRNIGFGEKIAILDRHILKNLLNLEVIDKIPETLTSNKYLEIENKLIDFSTKIKIPADHLDFVLWYKEAGLVFK